MSVLPLSALVPRTAFAQAAPASATASCNFDEEKQLVVEYQPVTVNLKKPLSSQVPFGKPWAPGGKPMTLFTNTPIQLGSRLLAIGAYTLFVIPNSKQWTLIVSKSTDMSGAYNEQDDLVRTPMDAGELPNPEASLAVALEHVAPSQCNIRIDLDKFGHFTAFQEK
ncbi:MAG TPA: DUF2911 domain-containing protein [Bryocella sp.]|nr:DUF2911 domain-containing protein [Bryocella sp.]